MRKKKVNTRKAKELRKEEEAKQADKINTFQTMMKASKALQEAQKNTEEPKAERKDAELSAEQRQNQRELQTAIWKGQ